MLPADREKNRTVFISYAHEGDLGERVATLAEWLGRKGMKVITDHPYRNRAPEEGWRAWMHHSVEKAEKCIERRTCSAKLQILLFGVSIRQTVFYIRALLIERCL